MNKNIRPYVISIDWLSIHVHRCMDFSFDRMDITYLYATDEQKTKFTFEDSGHGSKTYNHIINVYMSGQEFADLSFMPRQKEINSLSCSIRIVNKQLYEPNLMQNIAEFLTLYSFRFIGISRIDIAYDCNELYGGLRPEKLISKYLKGEIIKYGNSGGYTQFSQNYNLSVDGFGKLDLSEDVVICQNIHEYETTKTLVDGSSTKKPISTHTITWGTKASAVQTQLYNKSLEMKTKKYKQHIAYRWLNAGLDISKDVWRVEIRINSAGRLLENARTSETHILNMQDILFSEQLEIIFQSYANKYFKFFTLPRELAKNKSIRGMAKFDAMLKHKSRLTQYRVLSMPLRNKDMILLDGEMTIFIPRTHTQEGDYSRSIKSTMRVLESMIVSQANNAAPDIEHTTKVYENLKQAYGIERKKTFERKEKKAIEYIENRCNDIHDYYKKEWNDVEEKWFRDTAKRASMMEWGKIIAGANEYCYKYLFSIGYNVIPSQAEKALNLLMDTGNIPDDLLIDSEELWKDEYLHPYLSSRQ